jgi:drug/metabolite transporter (DMT)-like permease
MRRRAVPHLLDSPSNTSGVSANQSSNGMSHHHHHHHHHHRYINAVSLGQAAGYVLSGSSQPLLLQLLSEAGLANARAQVYMWFYYFGPALVLIPLLWRGDPWPRTIKKLIVKAIGIAVFDTIAASMNYAGASLAGPTIFAIVYSSVTVWTAIFSLIFLGRRLNIWQWLSVATVFGGLTITASDSLQLGDSVIKGCVLVLFGSAMHAMTYILCEAIMTVGEETLNVPQNCGIQSTVACTVLGVWQLVYTLPNWNETIGDPVEEANTPLAWAVALLVGFAFLNWVHSVTFYETLVHFPGGATSAGVMKGLQAVVVFVLTHLAFCGRTGGEELCFTKPKFISLITVVGGVIGYGIATQQKQQQQQQQQQSTVTAAAISPGGSDASSRGYESIETHDDIEIEAIKC